MMLMTSTFKVQQLFKAAPQVFKGCQTIVWHGVVVGHSTAVQETVLGSVSLLVHAVINHTPHTIPADT